MATEDLFIIAIELGSSNVTGVGGKKLPDGSIQIEAIAQEPSSMFIRNGMIFNMDKSVQCVSSIIKKLQEQLKRVITQVYVGYGGQSIHSELNKVTKRFDGEIPVSKEAVDELMKENLNNNVGDEDILEVICQEYRVGTQKQIDPVGVLSDYIEGRFLNIMARSSLRANIDNCFSKVGIHVVEDKLVPLTVADEVLSDTEKRSGCVLVDFGADTTTVSIYKANLLRFISVIPLGSANVTKDIMSCQLEENVAEELKLRYGMAVSDLTEEDAKGIIYTLPDGSEIDKGMLVEIVEARMEEILYNVKDQIASSGFGRDSLVAGAWLIGGGAKLRNISKAFSEIIGFDKVRVQKNTLTTVHFAKAAPKNMEDRLLGAISLLSKGNQICTSPQAPKEPIKDDFFQNNTVQDPGELTIIHSSNIKNETTENLGNDQSENKDVNGVQKDGEKPHKPKRKGPGIIKKAIKKLSEISKSIVEDD